MHLLSSHTRSEFLATPQLVRFVLAEGQSGLEPTLLLKASSLLLKYIVRGAPLSLTLCRIRGRLVYAVGVEEDPGVPTLLWSVLESQDEHDALLEIAAGRQFPVFLFNELALNVAWAPASANDMDDLLDGSHVEVGVIDQSAYAFEVSAAFDKMISDSEDQSEFIRASLSLEGAWAPLSNTLYAGGGVSLVDLFASDEGAQQEELAVWLTNNLQSGGAYHAPRIPTATGTRELTDVLLTHEFGTIIIESKTLSMFCREELPSREKLSRAVSKHLKKAVGQLQGQIGSITDGTVILDNDGRQIEVERTYPVHAIILIPEFDLVKERHDYGARLIYRFGKETNGFLHILDIAELLRVVQAAEMLAERGERTTPMMAFDVYLMERVKKAAAADSLMIEVLLRFVDP